MITFSIILTKGRIHISGAYQGGSSLTNEYTFTEKNSHRSTAQLISLKFLAQCETALHKTRGDIIVLAFYGKLEVNLGEIVPTELDQEQLMIAVRETVLIYGLRSFFYILGTDNIMNNLVKEPHSFELIKWQII